MRNIFLIFLFFCLTQKSYGQNKRQVYDGPYIEKKGDVFEINWIEKGRLKQLEVPLANREFFNVENLPIVNLSSLGFYSDSIFQFKGVKKFAAISDVHGQFDLMRNLLIQHEIIDTLDQWIFEDGHLVILGDIFDRGDKVTECLWFLFDLEKKALAKGGRVHVLLGNHEVMILHGDNSYSHPKYQYISGHTERAYSEMYGKNSVLGAWLRSKKVTISINDIVFVHGGFSEAVLNKEKRLPVINSIFKNQILPFDKFPNPSSDLLKELYFKNGPLWYRGYAEPKNFDIQQAHRILDMLGKETIVIGHTSMPQIFSLFSNSVILIDSSIKFGKTGELLWFENDLFYRAKLNGDKELLKDDDPKSQRTSLFDYIADVIGEDVRIDIKMEFDSVIYNKLEEKYFDAEYTLYDSGEPLHVMPARVRARGNMRKKLCNFPPLKMDFNKSNLKSKGFAPFDKLKLVIPCLEENSSEAYTLKEHLIYQLYRTIDTLGFRSKLAQIHFEDKDTFYNFNGFVLEDEECWGNRINGEVIEKGVIRSEGLDRESYLKVTFFQFMIANSDWSVSGRHNLQTVKLEDKERMVAVPYDFDYSGIVNQKYNVPEDRFPRMDMSQRKLRLKYISKEETDWIVAFYNERRDEMIELCKNAHYLPNSERASFQKSIEDFYKILNSKKLRKTYWPPKLQ